MAVGSAQARILLVGPRVIHLRPFFERRSYQVVAVARGVDGMSALDEARRDIVLLELNLGDLTATEFLMAARQAHASTSFLLLDDASKAGQIVKALQAGLDGYLPTPPDEDRLFFEIERHLKLQHGSGPPPMNPATTQISERPAELESIQTQLADRESQLVEVGMQNELLHQEVQSLRAEAKLLRDIKATLGPVLSAELDVDQATSIKDRLSMASVLETEADTLREELAEAKKARRELQDQVEQLRRDAESTKVAKVAQDSMEPEERKRKFDELEADNMVLAGKVGELEEELELARAEAVALEQKHKSDVDELQRELKRLTVDRASERGDVERTTQEHMATLQKLAREHQTEMQRAQTDLQRLQSEHADELARLKLDLEERTRKLQSDVEIERAAAEAKIAELLQKREAELAGGAEKARAELDKQLREALLEKEQAIEKALDIELLLDEHKVKIEFLEKEVKKAQDRAQKAEADFKRDKLRLVEEKEQAAAGSHEAFEKIQRFVEENSQLKRQNAELEAMRSALEARARAGDDALAAATLERETTSRDRAELEANRSALESEARRLRERVQALDAELGTVRGQLQAAVAALGDAGVMAARLADTVAQRDTAEKEAARLGEQVRDLERTIERMVADVDAARGETATGAVLVDDLRARAEHAEQQLAAATERAASDRSAMEAQLKELSSQMRAQADAYEEKLRAALSGSGAAPAAVLDEVLAERDAYRQRIQETDAWVQQAQLHLEAFAAERAQLDARAQEALAEAQAKQAEAQELYTQLASAKHTVEQLTARAAGLEERLEQASRGAAVEPAALQEAQAELRALRAQLVQAQRGGPGQLPEEIEPLRWTLNAAIEQLTTLESREPGLGTHLRNLRLLAQALQRLSGR